MRVVEFSRNFGKEAAIYAGLEHSSGDICVLIDTDMQQPPAIARQMVDILLDDKQRCFDCVAAYQEQRKRGHLRNWCSSMFYRVLGASSGMDVLADASDFRAFRANVRDALLGMTEYFRFSKGLFSWIGFKDKGISVYPRRSTHGRNDVVVLETGEVCNKRLNVILNISIAHCHVAGRRGFDSRNHLYGDCGISALTFWRRRSWICNDSFSSFASWGVTAARSWRYGRVSLESVYARKEASNLYKAFL